MNGTTAAVIGVGLIATAALAYVVITRNGQQVQQYAPPPQLPPAAPASASSPAPVFNNAMVPVSRPATTTSSPGGLTSIVQTVGGTLAQVGKSVLGQVGSQVANTAKTFVADLGKSIFGSIFGK